ncbi:hypothetical protein [Pseudomonas putida]|uniref:hypothetical protein n=1 Tax=Pseudomonas putida TaxID=303 RepID=UPI0034644BC0
MLELAEAARLWALMERDEAWALGLVGDYPQDHPGGAQVIREAASLSPASSYINEGKGSQTAAGDLEAWDKFGTSNVPNYDETRCRKLGETQ